MRVTSIIITDDSVVYTLALPKLIKLSEQVKNPKRQEADQLATYKCSQGVGPETTCNINPAGGQS